MKLLINLDDYEVGQKVEYKTAKISSINNGEKLPLKKEGIIEEVFTTLDNILCYWIEGEKELILHPQITRVLH